MAELTVENLHLQYGDNPILKGVTMTLNRGEVVSLLGPSGSGKTTLLRAVAGLEVPHQGSIRIGDKVVFDGSRRIDVPAEARNLGLVFQSYALWPHKTVFDNVAYGLKLRNVGASDVTARVTTALEQLSLGHLAQRFPHQLSGGQQQRVALARALVYNPPVILLDEPLSNLDAKLREEARAWLRELIVRMQLSALCVTHDQGGQAHLEDQLAQPGARFLAQLGVEVGQRLVQQDHGRAVDQGACDRHALLLAAGELVREAVAEVAEAEVAERRVDALADLGGGDLAQLETVADVVGDGLVRPEGVGLEHQAEVAFLGRHLEARGGVEHGAVLDPDRPPVWKLESGDRPQQRRLAAARRPEQRHDLALGELHRHALEDGVVAVGKMQVVDAQLGRCDRGGRVRGRGQG